jgi:polar amino acid transport system permease protein
MRDLVFNDVLFLLQGLKWTIILSLIAFAGGGVVGLTVALARVSSRRVLRGLMICYIVVLQGTPLLLQLFVVYFGLALLNLPISSWVAVAIGLTLNASAFLGDIWRGGIEAVPRGQSQAAEALGLSYVSRMRDVILPQAFRIVLPATVGFSVQIIKGTSLAAIIGFTELSRSGQLIANATFRPLLMFGVIGAMYFVLCWPLSALSVRLEKRLAVSR